VTFPLSLADVTLWLGVTAILLFVTSELLSAYYGRVSILIETRRLRQMALFFGVLFLVDALIEVCALFFL
jgi:hypothetical protein